MKVGIQMYGDPIALAVMNEDGDDIAYITISHVQDGPHAFGNMNAEAKGEWYRTAETLLDRIYDALHALGHLKMGMLPHIELDLGVKGE